MAAMSTDPRLKRYTTARPIKPKRTPTQKAMDEERKRRRAMYDRCANAKTSEEKLAAYVERARARIQPRLPPGIEPTQEQLETLARQMIEQDRESDIRMAQLKERRQQDEAERAKRVEQWGVLDKERKQLRRKLAAALSMLGSDYPAERDMAAQTVEALRRKLGMGWDDMLRQRLGGSATLGDLF
jgi:hypothetical protein